jgi:hypothetical protein
VQESPICYCDPGMTNANMTFVEIDVDGDSEQNVDVEPELEVRPALTAWIARTVYKAGTIRVFML